MAVDISAAELLVELMTSGGARACLDAYTLERTWDLAKDLATAARLRLPDLDEVKLR